jgi:hypothetical protein
MADTIISFDSAATITKLHTLLSNAILITGKAIYYFLN